MLPFPTNDGQARLAPIRSAEYGIPIFSVWSSGQSQLTDRSGRDIATAGYPGQGQSLSGPFALAAPGRIPPDRPLAFASAIVTGIFCTYLIFRRLFKRRHA